MQKSIIWFLFLEFLAHQVVADYWQAAAGSPVFDTFFQAFFLRLSSLGYRDLICRKQPYLHVYTFGRLFFNNFVPVISLKDLIADLSTNITYFRYMLEHFLFGR